MAEDTLKLAMAAISDNWGPLSSELVSTCKARLQMLARSSPKERWLAALRAELPDTRELYRDPDHGFVLLAHTEIKGLYRPPHDHGRSWVIYTVLQGGSEMGTYGQAQDDAGNVYLVRRDSTLVKPGQVQVYLPGDIHDTRCVAGPTLLLRFTAMDLKHEDLIERRVTRYAERGGCWNSVPQ